MKNLVELGNLIKRARTEKNLSVFKFSEKISVSSGEISSIENANRQDPAPSILRKMATGLGLNYITLMQLAGHIDDSDFETANAKQKTLKDDLDSVRALTDSSIGLSEDDKKEILNIALEIQLKMMKR